MDSINETIDNNKDEKSNLSAVEYERKQREVKNDDSFDDHVCQEAQTPQARKTWCSEKYGNESELVERCHKRFCTFCCEDIFPNNMIQGIK